MSQYYYIAKGRSPDFEGTIPIVLQSGDVSVPYKFKFSVCSGATENDGAIPYGVSASSFTVTAHRVDGTAATTSIIVNSSFASTDSLETVYLSYSSAMGTGTYHLTFTAIVVGATSGTMEWDFNRVLLRDN